MKKYDYFIKEIKREIYKEIHDYIKEAKDTKETFEQALAATEGYIEAHLEINDTTIPF